MTKYVSKYNWNKLFAPWALTLANVNGETYGLPTELETVILYYNKNIFEENEWTPPRTIQEMLLLAEVIDKKGIIPFASAYGACMPCNEWIIGQFLNHWFGKK